MSSWEAKRQRIADLIVVGVKIRRIAENIGVLMSTAYTVKGQTSIGEGIKKKLGSGE